MGLRFRRSVKLIPGVRLNFSGSGVSMSLGGRGATVNLSSRGTRTTLGIPGTGASWSQSRSATSSRASGTVVQASTTKDLADLIRRVERGGVALRDPETSRKFSLPQLHSRLRRLQQEETRLQGEALVRAEAEQYAEILNSWRHVPKIPESAHWSDITTPQPFTPEPPPHRPDEDGEREAYRGGLIAQVKGAHPPSLGEIFKWSVAVLGTLVGVGMVGALALVIAQVEAASAALGMVVVSLLAVFAAIACARHLRHKRGAHVASLADARLAAEWPQRWSDVVADHKRAEEAHAADQDAARGSWDAQERDRTAGVQALLRGEATAVADAVEEALEGLDVPFETECAIAVEGGELFVNLDLPEIEDFVQQNAKTTKRDGTVTEKQRTKKDQQADYAGVVVGLAFRVAMEAFAAAPSLAIVHVAGYTQRVAKNSGNVEDEHVFELALRRDALRRLDFARVDPVEALAGFEHRIKRMASGELRAIPAPEWAA